MCNNDIIGDDKSNRRLDSLEALRVEEVEQVKELLQVVLQWSTSQEQLVLEVIHAQHAKELQ